MLFVALRYTSYIQHQTQEARKKQPPSPLEGLADPAPRANVDPNSPTGQQEALGGELLATEGVSLG